jgi:hypothetical protein
MEIINNIKNWLGIESDLSMPMERPKPKHRPISTAEIEECLKRQLNKNGYVVN